MVLPALAAGALAGSAMLLLAHLAPFFGAGNFIKELEDPHIFQKPISHREGQLIGVLIHLVLSMLFAGVYALLVEHAWVKGFELVPLILWSVVMTIFVGGVILPLEGHGIFGLKEDAWFPVDLLLANALWAVLFWWFLRLWSNLPV
jgi:hypothetical protein